ncbi:MAG: hypothetical protein HQ517_16910 [SAR324 cluster bacterium]|nr:hypothetical protein [SAR324 cluster bacterium]
MKIVSGLLELVVIIASAVLIRWGALSGCSTGELTREQKRMTSIGLMLLLSWVVLAGIPGFIRSVRESGELKRFKNNGYQNGNQDNHSQDKRKHEKKKKKHGKLPEKELKRKFAGK